MVKKIKNKLLIYQPIVVKTYLHFIRENLKLIEKIYSDKKSQSKNANKYYLRAKHLQVMTLIGLTAEHLIKLILLKKGYVLNEAKMNVKFSNTFMQKLKNIKESNLSQKELNNLYKESIKDINISFKGKLKNFDKCIKLFNDLIPTNYYLGIKEYDLNSNPSENNSESYLGHTKITPKNTFKIIQKMRNNYLHLAEAKSEQQGIIWYLFNFLVFISKKEYPDFFKKINYIGNKTNKELFHE